MVHRRGGQPLSGLFYLAHARRVGQRYRVFPGPAEEYWPEFRLLEEPEGKITAIEVEALVFNILRTDRPREVETRSYTSTYNPLNWVIELP